MHIYIYNYINKKEYIYILYFLKDSRTKPCLTYSAFTGCKAAAFYHQTTDFSNKDPCRVVSNPHKGRTFDCRTRLLFKEDTFDMRRNVEEKEDLGRTMLE